MVGLVALVLSIQVAQAETLRLVVMAPPTERSLEDRPDDFTGPQIHAIYAVPKDRPDRQRDMDGRIAASLSSVQNFLRFTTVSEAILDPDAAGLRFKSRSTAPQILRVDTYLKGLDVSYARLDLKDAEIRGDDAYDPLIEELQKKGFNRSGKEIRGLL